MIADAFLRLRTISRLFKSRNHVVGQGYQGNVFISQVNAREEMRSESGNGSSSSLWNLSRSSRYFCCCQSLYTQRRCFALDIPLPLDVRRCVM